MRKTKHFEPEGTERRQMTRQGRRVKYFLASKTHSDCRLLTLTSVLHFLFFMFLHDEIQKNIQRGKWNAFFLLLETILMKWHFHDTIYPAELEDEYVQIPANKCNKVFDLLTTLWSLSLKHVYLWAIKPNCCCKTVQNINNLDYTKIHQCVHSQVKVDLKKTGT